MSSRSIRGTAALAIAAVVTAGGAARADVPDPPPPPRVFHVPTAWLQPAGTGYGSLGLSSNADYSGGGLFALSGGLGRLAEVDVEVTDRIARCTASCGEDDDPAARKTSTAAVASALFKIGVGNGRWASWQPALALGFRKSFFARAPADDLARPKLAELYLAVSRPLGSVHVHAGAQLFDVGIEDDRLLDRRDGLRALRPFAGLEWRPSIYPRTTLLADFSWAPELQADAGGSGPTSELLWVAGWGVRYQALSWGSVELGVRHRENEGIEDSTVFVRVNGVTSFRSPWRGDKR